MLTQQSIEILATTRGRAHAPDADGHELGAGGRERVEQHLRARVARRSQDESRRELQVSEGIDASPEGGAALAGAVSLLNRGLLRSDERIVVFNTGAGWLYRA